MGAGWVVEPRSNNAWLIDSGCKKGILHSAEPLTHRVDESGDDVARCRRCSQETANTPEASRAGRVRAHEPLHSLKEGLAGLKHRTLHRVPYFE